MLLLDAIPPLQLILRLCVAFNPPIVSFHSTIILLSTKSYISLQILQALQDDITKKRPDVVDTQETAEWIGKNNTHDPKVKQAVKEKVDAVERTYNNFSTKVDIRLNRLQSALLKGQEFQTTFDDFIANLDDLETRLDSERPLDARLDELKEIKQEHEVSHVRSLHLECTIFFKTKQRSLLSDLIMKELFIG